MNDPSLNSSVDDEITLRQIVSILWRGKWLIMLACMVGVIAAAVGAKFMPKSYKALTVLSVATPSSGQLGGIGALASQFSGLASLAGISATASGDTQKAESIAVLQSEALTEKYIKENDLLPLLYKSRWDAEKHAWKDADTKKIPTLWTANAYFKAKIRTVLNDPKTGLILLSVTYTDPVVAAKWANDLVKMTNDYLRNKAVAESELNMAYLHEQAAKTDIVEARQAIYKILEGEINKVMLAKGNKEYAFKILDPAVPPEKPSSPVFLLWVACGFFGSLTLVSLVLVLRATWEKVPP